MRLGEKLRQLRQDRELTQPELAEALGIEQSYLSKLENSKYVPSSEVFGRILQELKLEVGDVVDDLEQRDRNSLRQIPVVAAYFNDRQQLIIGNRRHWLFGSAVLTALGTALIYGGTVDLVGDEFEYRYESPGIVLDGEPKEIFQWCTQARRNANCTEELVPRIDRLFLQTRSYQGDIFNEPVDSGSRTYFMSGSFNSESWLNKGISTIGVLFTVFGLMGVLLEKKLSRFQ